MLDKTGGVKGDASGAHRSWNREKNAAVEECRGSYGHRYGVLHGPFALLRYFARLVCSEVIFTGRDTERA